MAPNAEATRTAARRANLPADVTGEVSDLRPEMFSQKAAVNRTKHATSSVAGNPHQSTNHPIGGCKLLSL
jgi:hypothetical protein